MELNVDTYSDTKLVVEVDGAGHTLCNVVKEELWNDDAVTASAYTVDHPMVGEPSLVIETDGKDPAEALQDATDRVQERHDDFLDTVHDALS